MDVRGLMRSKDRITRVLSRAVVFLGLSVLLTGGLAIYLTLVPEGQARLMPSQDTAADTEDSRIVYVSDREGDIAIYILQPDGTGQARISGEGQSNSLYPAWSPDGTRVAYLAVEDLAQEWSADLWSVALDGSESLNVTGAFTHVSGVPPVWSPDGGQIALVSGVSRPSNLYLVESDGSGVAKSFEVEGSILEVDWSPTGEEIALRVADPDGEPALVVTSVETGEILHRLPGALAADWSPDGHSIVYFTGGDEERLVSILDLDEGSPRQIADLGSAVVETMVVSPDGARAILVLLDPYDQFASTLGVLDLASGEITRIVEDDGWVAMPSWAPDGEEILYTRGPLRHRSDSDLPYADLWIYDFTTATARHLTAEPGFAGFGVWSP